MIEPKVGVIIVNYNGWEMTDKCLQSLIKANFRNLEVLVVDNHSKDQSVAHIQKDFPSVKLIKSQQNLGFGGGNNLGFDYFKTKQIDYYFLLNNDATVNSKTISTMVEYLSKHPKVDLINPKIYQTSNHKIWFEGGKMRWWLAQPRHQPTEHPDWLTGAALMIRREVVEKIGKFDARFFLYLEDVDYSLRAKEAGFQLALVSQASADHEVSQSTGGTGKPFSTYFEIRNNLLLIRKHYQWWLRPLIYFTFSLVILKRIINIIFTSNDKKSMLSAIWRAKIDFLKSKFGRQNHEFIKK